MHELQVECMYGHFEAQYMSNRYVNTNVEFDMTDKGISRGLVISVIGIFTVPNILTC